MFHIYIYIYIYVFLKLGPNTQVWRKHSYSSQSVFSTRLLSQISGKRKTNNSERNKKVSMQTEEAGPGWQPQSKPAASSTVQGHAGEDARQLCNANAPFTFFGKGLMMQCDLQKYDTKYVTYVLSLSSHRPLSWWMTRVKISTAEYRY